MRPKTPHPFVVPPAAYTRDVHDLVRRALAEDIGTGDITTKALKLPRERVVSHLQAHEDGVLAGVDAFEAAFRHLDPRVEFFWYWPEGHDFQASDMVVNVRGQASALLSAERTAINFLAHLSGVATAARRMVVRIPPRTARLLDTRKTTPGWRLLEKHAAAVGGALNHRLGLYDAAMIKGNHVVAAQGLTVALSRARKTRRPLICEAHTYKQITTALDAGVTWLLLDNYTPAHLKEAVRFIRRWEREHGTRITLEASGNVTMRNVAAFARTGVDYISSGSITHSAPAIDFSLTWFR
ncbi:MAG: carboxylating nicotinate-nucleotide diphosphorylase [Candidatus Zixiibacteriota bacterium]